MSLSVFFKKLWFPIALVVLFILGDLGLAHSGWIQNSGYFWLNDLEVTQKYHPEEVWDKVAYGSSELISAYREELATSGYVNAGMDYGTVLDLNTMLEKKTIQVGSDLVLACSWGLLYDDLPTNPTYIWLKKPLEPYAYFQRDRFGPFIKDEWKAMLGAGEWRTRANLEQTKTFYYGNMTAEELQERLAILDEKYFCNGVEAFSDNLAALPDLFAWCRENGVRLRVLWLPEHPDAPLGPVNDQVREEVRALCAGEGVPFTDMTAFLPADCFYDTGHLDYDHGAAVFTEVLDQWLAS